MNGRRLDTQRPCSDAQSDSNFGDRCLAGRLPNPTEQDIRKQRNQGNARRALEIDLQVCPR